MSKRHAYLIINGDKTEGFLYTDMKQAKSKVSSMQGEYFVFEWMDTSENHWCDPYQAYPKTDGFLFIRDKNHFVWKILKQANETGNWFSQIKYPKNGLKLKPIYD